MKKIKFISLMVIIILLSSCNSNDSNKNNKPSEEKKYVKVQNISENNFKAGITLPGTLEASNSVILKSNVKGDVISIEKSLGDEVKKGEVLAKIKDDVYKKNYENAKNNYENSLIQLNKVLDAEKNKDIEYQPVASAKNNYTIAKTKFEEVEDTYNDMKILYEKGGVSKSDLDKTESNYVSAKESYEMAKNNYLTAKNNYKYDVKQLKLAANTAKNTMENAKENYEDTFIKAPIDGVISQENLSLGQEITPGQITYEIVNLNQLVASVGVSEKDINKVNKDQKVKVYVKSLDKEFLGKVSKVGPSPDINTKKYPVEVIISNDKKLIKDKMYGEIYIISSEKKLTSIPKKAVLKESDKSFIYTLDKKNIAHKKQINILTQENDYYGIEEKISSDHKLIILGQNYIEDKDKVDIKK